MNDLTYESLVKAYEDGGYTAVEKLCEPHNLPRAWCEPCEMSTPTFEDGCACCGTIRKKLKKYHVYVTRVETHEVEAENGDEAIEEFLQGRAESIQEDTTDVTAELAE
jgi:hypothetical protein